MCEREREREIGRHGHITIAACAGLCSPLGLELMVKLRTLLTVFTFILKAKAGDYGKGRYSSVCLWCSANHNALCQLANQSRLCLSEGGTLQKTKQVGITADWRSPKWGVNSKSGQNLQNGAGSLRAKTFTIGSGFSQLLLTYISK